MTSKQILALIKSHIAEYSAQVDQQYLGMLTSATVKEHDAHKYQADIATAQVATLSRLLYAIEHPGPESEGQ